MTTAFGFVELKDLYNDRVSQVGSARIFTAVQESAEEYSRVANELLAEFSERTTIAQEQIELPGDGTLQPLDENGNPKPVKPSGSYKVAYPIQGGGTAWGDNRVTRALMTVDEARRLTEDALQRDADWMTRHLLASLFDNVTWTYNDKAGAGSKGLGDITIQPLANGDTVTYARKGGVAAATDDHYLAQSSAIDDSNNPFPTIETELLEHPSNGKGRILVYIPTNLKATVTGLTSFIEVDDDNIVYGDDTDRVTNVPAVGPGEEVLGYISGTKCWIIHWSALPDSYMIAKMEGVAVTKTREYPAEELQGFFPEFSDIDGNKKENRMIRYAGFGVSNRVAALVYRIGNASYAIPTGYDAPLAA